EKTAKETYLILAKTLAVACEAAIRDQNLAVLNEWVKHASEQENIEYVLIQDAHNVVIACTGSKHVGDRLTDEISEHANQAIVPLIQEAHGEAEGFLHGSGHLFDLAVPIFDKGQKIGTVRVGISTKTLNQQVVASSHHGLKLIAIAVVIGAVLILFVDWKLRGTLRKLIRVTRQMANGDLSQQVDIQTGDELQTLGDSFNQMAGALKGSQEELEKWSHELEDRVAERTLALKQAQAQLLQSEKLASLGELVGNIAHEINNPIGIILSRIDVMRFDAEERMGEATKPLPDSFVEDLAVLEKHARRIANTTHGLLTFARQSSEEFAETDVNAVLEETLALVESQLTKVKITLQTDLAPHLPLVMGNGNQLGQVFLNLFNNARDAMSEGGTLHIQTALCENLTPAQQTIKVVVEDTGVGILPEHLNRIFEPFFTTKEPGKGTGLGLSVSYGLISAHGGKIRAQSEVGIGTKFIISLPISQ
ncbi:MAG: ATP-binding protein, partial [Candidatus Poribacteria bacterium]|nr:ATP-binding protein [Candidatus Poribacteria bacterium]